MLVFYVDHTFQFQSVLLSVIVIQMHTSHAHTTLPNKFPLLESSIRISTAAPAGFSSSSFRGLLLLVSHFLCFYLPRLSFPLSFFLSALAFIVPFSATLVQERGAVMQSLPLSVPCCEGE